MGRLDPSKLAAVEGGVDVEAVRAIFAAKLGRPLGLDAVAAAAAVIRIADARMAGAIRMVSISLGADPRDFALFAFGGAGPMHAAALARELGVPKVLVPARPGLANALGCAVADLRHDFVRTLNLPLDDLDDDAVADVFAEQIRQGDALLDRERAAIRERRYLFSVDMQFVGQSHILRAGLESPSPTRAELMARFEAVYWDRFRIRLDNMRAKLVNANTAVIGVRPPIDLSRLIDADARATTLAEAETGRRPVFFDGAWQETPVYWRDRLPADYRIVGPAIVEQMDTTVLIPPGDRAEAAADGGMLITLEARA